MRKGPARGPFIHIGSGGLICTDPTVPQNEEFRAYLEEKMSTAPDRQPMPIGVVDCSLQRTDRQLWVYSVEKLGITMTGKFVRIFFPGRTNYSCVLSF